MSPATADAVGEFREALRAAGIEPPAEIIADGRLHRFATSARRGDDAGWYVLHSDGIPAGAYGDWRSGISGTWRAEIGRRLTAAEERAQRERIERARREAEALREREAREAAMRAAEIWRAAQPAPDHHLYVRARGIRAHGARVYRGDLAIGGMACDGALVIALRDAAGEIQSVEFVAAGGEKRFLPGGRTAGAYAALGAPGDPIIIAEGWATGAAIHEATGHAVRCAMSAGNLRAVAEAMRARAPHARIIIAGDHDASGTGQRAAEDAARAVGGYVAIPERVGEDWCDVYREHGADAVRRGIAAASAPAADAAPGACAVARAGDAPGSPAAAPSTEPAHPVLDEVALHGLAGEIVRAIEPQTEADPVALLVQVLVAFGALVGRGPHYRVEGDEHHAHLFALLVGATAKARKGTSWGRVREIYSRVAGWPRIVDGLSSGEGVKWAVRDPIRRHERDKDGNIAETETDPGVSDKRLLVVETEFAQVLRQAARTGNTLSATIRSAWDTGRLATLTKNDPVTATGAHISIIGHITADELRAELTATDAANGFANRFLYVCTRRSKMLPFGGEALAEQVAAGFAERLARAAEHARRLGAVPMTDAARETWAAVYPVVSAGQPGLHGAITARAEAQCVRLALVYALMDGAEAIDRPHLLAALAVWEYADASARYIFGDALGDPVADEILRALRGVGAAGMTRTEIRDLFARHQTAERIQAALELLARRRLIERDTRAADTGGRAAEVWRCGV
jgi:phage/plasmid primase-like uncharacterized protein